MDEKTWKKIIALVRKGYTQTEVAATLGIERPDLSQEVKYRFQSWGNFRIKCIFKSHENYKKIIGKSAIATSKMVPKNSKVKTAKHS